MQHCCIYVLIGMIIKPTLGADNLGIISSLLCFIHCLVTPFVFLATTCSEACTNASPYWWQFMDWLFLVLSLYAVYHTAKHTDKVWIKIGLVVSWLFLLFIVVNEYLEVLTIFKEIIYFPVITLSLFHFYNKKYCRC